MNIFLNQGLYESNSGVEHAQFYRLRAFEKLNAPVKLVYSDLLPQLQDHLPLFDLKEEQVINLYDWCLADDPADYLQNGLRPESKQPYAKRVEKDFTNTNRTVVEQATAGYTITRRKEKVWNEEKGLYIVSDAQVELTRGTRRLVWSYDRFQGEKVMTAIHLENFQGDDYYFQSFYELLAFFMRALEAAFGPSTYFLDRDRAYDEYLVKRNEAGGQNRLVSVIHAAHRVEKVDGRQVYNQFYQFVLDHAPAYDKIVVATKRQAKELAEDVAQLHPGTNAELLVTAVPVGFLDADKASRARTADALGPLRLVTASRLHPEKHVDQLIDAMALLQKDGVPAHLTVYGKGAEQEKLEKQVADAGLTNAVTFAGFSKSLEEAFAKFDFYVSASYSEGFGLTYLEALGAGLPVLTYANEYGARELIASGKNGQLVDFSPADKQQNALNMASAVKTAAPSNDSLKFGAFESSKAYRAAVVAASWQRLLDDIQEVSHDHPTD